MTIYDIISRAEALARENKLASVTPERVGNLIGDTLKYINSYQLLASSPLMHKTYASVSAMQADASPVSDLTGNALKKGQLVVIVPADQSDATAGDVYRYDGPSGNTSAWTFIAKIGGVPADAELDATSTNPVQNQAVTAKLTELDLEVKQTEARIDGNNLTILHDCQQGKGFGESGFSTYRKYALSNKISSGVYNFPSSNDYYYNAVKYVSDTEGVEVFPSRVASIKNVNIDSDFYITFRKVDGSDMDASDVYIIESSFFLTTTIGQSLEELREDAKVLPTLNKKAEFLYNTIVGQGDSESQGEKSVANTRLNIVGETSLEKIILVVNQIKGDLSVFDVYFSSSANPTSSTISAISYRNLLFDFSHELEVPNGYPYIWIYSAATTTGEYIYSIYSTFKEGLQQRVAKIENELEGVEEDCLCLGDSLTEGIGVLWYNNPVESENTYPNQLAKILKNKAYNGGIGGSTLCESGYAPFTMVVDALVSKNFAALDEILNSLTGVHVVSKQRYEEIKSLDLSSIGFVNIAYGTNDWSTSKELDNLENDEDKNTVCGALRYGVRRLMSAFPNLRIYVFTPAYRYLLGDAQNQDSDNYQNNIGKYISDYADAIENACKQLHVPCKNMYYESNINASNVATFYSDGVHRNAKGYKLMAEQYAKFILSK